MTELTILAQYRAASNAPTESKARTIAVVVAEEGPRSHLVTFEEVTYEIWVPWSVYAVHQWAHSGRETPSYLQNRVNTSYFMGWRTAPMATLTDRCRSVPLPNAYHHAPCLGMAVGREDRELSPLECLYRAWWYGVINTDGWPGMLCSSFRTALLGAPGDYGSDPYDYDNYRIVRRDLRLMLRAWEIAGDHAPTIWAETPSPPYDEATLEQIFFSVPNKVLLSTPMHRCSVSSLAPLACGAQP